MGLARTRTTRGIVVATIVAVLVGAAGCGSTTTFVSGGTANATAGPGGVASARGGDASSIASGPVFAPNLGVPMR
jgi:hypothetical protein